MAFRATVLIVGRLSGPKNGVILRILREVAPEVVRLVPGTAFRVVGGPLGEEHRELQRLHPAVRFEGHQDSLGSFYRRADLVVGSGRVALEAMVLGKPVVAVGERQYIGPLFPDKLERAKATNFGDCAETEGFDGLRMARDLCLLLKNARIRSRVARTGRALAESEYAMGTVYPRMEGLYRQVLLRKNLSLVHELPVLMYHRVVEKEPDFTKFNIHVTRARLEEHLGFLDRSGFHTIGFSDLLARRIPEKPLILTFDDGYEDNYHHLFPLLRKHRMKAVVYVLGDRKRRDNFWDTSQGEPPSPLLKEKQILEMSGSGLVEFGSHSLTHAPLPDLGPARVRRETAGSKKSLEDFLGKPVVSFAYPYGRVDKAVKRITREAGYAFGIAVHSGPSRFGEDLMEIRRVHMFPHTNLFDLWKKTSGFYHRYRKWTGRN
jgi:peptidoglycan/xylan/chitin deacetylase (PgdA/CDA1 family)